MTLRAALDLAAKERSDPCWESNPGSPTHNQSTPSSLNGRSHFT